MIEERPELRVGEDAEAVVGRMRALLHVCIALNTVDDPDRLLAHIAETTQSVLRCQAASILLLPEPGADHLRFAAATGPVGERLVGQAVPLDSLAGTVYRENRVLLAVEADADRRRYRKTDEATGFTTRVVLGVPMRLDGRPVGVLQALNPLPEGREETSRFDAADAEMLFVIAAQAAVALQHARHTEALERARRELEELTRLKANFVAITSHELRTPLTAVQGFGEVLAEEAPGELADAARHIVSAGHRMRDLVETLDVMAGLDGRQGLHPLRDVDLGPLIAQAAADVGRPVGLSLPDGALVVRGDALRLALAVGNVVDNAVRFSAPGEPVSVQARACGERVEVEVADAGRGLAPEDLERVFGAFVQVACPDRRDHEGLGVGLTVARGIAEQHGGSLVAESAGLGEGATFRFVLPRAEPAA